MSLRFFTVYGPRQRPDMAFSRLVDCAMTGSEPFLLYGDGSRRRDFTYVDDVVNAVRLSALSPWTGVANIGGGSRTTMNRVIDLVSGLARSVDVVRLPVQRGDVRHTAADTTAGPRGLRLRPDGPPRGGPGQDGRRPPPAASSRTCEPARPLAARPPAGADPAAPAQPVLPHVKVLHVITRFWAGAGGNTLLSAVGMDPDRYETWIAGCPGGPLWERAGRPASPPCSSAGSVRSSRPVDDIYVLVQLVRLIRRERFAIVHTHSAKGGFLGRLAAWLCRTPVVVHTFHGFSVHDFMSRRKRRGYLLLERAVRRPTHAFFAVSPRVAREAVELRLAPPGTVSVVPSAVELDDSPLQGHAAAACASCSASPHGAPLVGTVGRIDRRRRRSTSSGWRR